MNTELYIPATAEKIKKVEDLLLVHCGTQMKNIWLLGLNIGCRIDELLSLKFSDLDRDMKQIKLSRDRHKNTLDLYLTPVATEILSSIREKYPKDEFIFQCKNRQTLIIHEPKPIAIKAVNKAFKKVGDILNVKLLPHSMRASVLKSLAVSESVPSNFVGRLKS